MNKTRSSNLPIILIVVGVVAVAAVAYALASVGGNNLGARGPSYSSSTPSGRLVDSLYQCTAQCACYREDPGESAPAHSTPAAGNPGSRSSDADDEFETGFTACVTVTTELEDDARNACKKACKDKGLEYLEDFEHPDNQVQCKRIGTC